MSESKKAFPSGKAFQFSGGADGTRTRDPRRDRPFQPDYLYFTYVALNVINCFLMTITFDIRFYH